MHEAFTRQAARSGGLLSEEWHAGGGWVHPVMRGWPLRPEMLESAWALFEATGDYQFVEQVGGE